ncbi:MAG TPA: hypothetical protein VGD45_11085 [Steroidobacter sp.]|uniref:hypothetical protein n=1 Tax=Steroidobacter sp. TaxID=1978227 RepID=UPI002EDB472D
MSKVVLILAATSVGLGLVSLHLVKQLRDSDATVTALKTQVAELEKQTRVTAVPPVFSVMPAPPVAAVAVTQAVPSNDAAKPAAARASAEAQPMQMRSREDAMRMMREHRERERQLMQDPEYREAMRLQARNNLARQHPDVIEELGLNPKQAEEFFGMLADQQMRSQELMSPPWADAENLDPAVQQERYKRIHQTASEMQRNNEAELATRFGQDKLLAWKEYQSTWGMRYQLDHMRSTLAATGMPLDEELSKPLLKALAEAQKAEMDAYNTAAKQGGPGAKLAASVAFESNNGEWQLEQTKKRNQRMLDAISSYLTYEQRTAIEKEQQAQLKMQEAQMRLMRERGDANGNRGFYSTSGNAQLIPLQ